ncbi:MAG: four helix bundle protein [Bacteroidota bacterium]|nr:four helix bundle protein [Bacteroidota bacterium]
MNEAKIYDLEERTLRFSLAIRSFVKRLPYNLNNQEDGKQLIRSSGSVGANYIEANDSLGERDKLMKIRICRKEAKESRYWLMLLDTNGNADLEIEKDKLAQEAYELMLILGNILKKLTQKAEN